jgi:MscS family membrane protein
MAPNAASIASSETPNGEEAAAPRRRRRPLAAGSAPGRPWLLAASLAIAAALVPFCSPASPRLPVTSAAPTPVPAEVAADAYGRESPRGCFFGFLRAAENGRYRIAAEYLQIPAALEGSRAEIARQFQSVLDHRFIGPRVDRISSSPRGSLEDGLPENLESVGEILGEAGRFDVMLVRQAPEGQPAYWLFSWDTVREARRLYQTARFPRLEQKLPPVLTQTRIFGLTLWQILAFLLLLPILYGVSWAVIAFVAWIFRQFRRGASGEWATSAHRPATALLTLLLHRAALAWLGLPVLYRVYYNRVLYVLVFLGVLWLLFRLVDVIDRYLMRRVMPVGAARGRSTLALTRGALRWAAVVLVILLALPFYGVNVTAALAGLGVGGLVLALAAQKSLENVFGGFAILSDRPLQVGDLCRIAGQLGEIEDITLWNTRLRTFERVLVSIPNGAVVSGQIENLSRRDKYWFHPIVGLVYETTSAQMRQVLEKIRDLLVADPRIETEGSRARFLRFGAYSLDIEVFGYVRAEDYPSFLAIQEELLLRVFEIVESAGTSVAFPTQTVFMRPESGPEAAK